MQRYYAIVEIWEGSSLKRGFKAMLERKVEAVVVVDGDGQHDPQEFDFFGCI